MSVKPKSAASLRSDVGRYAMLPEWLLDAGISDKAIKLFCILAAKYADRTGEAYPSRSTLAKDLGVVRAQTVDAALRELVAANALAVTNRKGEGGIHDTNVYTLRFTRPAALESVEQDVAPEEGLPSPAASTTVDPVAVKGVAPEQGLKPEHYRTRSKEPESSALFEMRRTPSELVELWNHHREPGPKVQDLTDKRERLYAQALAAKPLHAEWVEAITWLNGQPWANARGLGDHATWRATLDWLAKPGQLTTILEQARTDAIAPPAKPRRLGDLPGRGAQVDEATRTRRQAYQREQDALEAEAAALVLDLTTPARLVLEREAMVELDNVRERVTPSAFDDMVLNALPKILVQRAHGRPLADVVAELEAA